MVQHSGTCTVVVQYGSPVAMVTEIHDKNEVCFILPHVVLCHVLHTINAH